MAEDPRPMTLQQRIAALHASHVGRIPGEVPLPSARPKPLLPTQRPIVRQKSFNLPSTNTTSTTATPAVANTPSGPPPLPSRKKPPPLPARKSSQEEDKTNGTNDDAKISSNSVRVTATRTNSENKRVKAPAWGCDLPPLPPKEEPKQRTKSFTNTPRAVNRKPSTSSIASLATTASIQSYQGPPPLPSRKSSESSQITTPRKVPPLPSTDALAKARQLSFSSVTSVVDDTTPTPPLPTRRSSGFLAQLNQMTQTSHSSRSDEVPPPVPKPSRPDLSALQATKPKLNGAPAPSVRPSASGCMTCRDFSGPDKHAARFPREQVTSLQNLAIQLTVPFLSLTDKARTIFTWLHHNIDYNVRDFFGGNVKGSTPQSTLQTGLAVCEGYAALFANLATYAGLESVVVTGHGKGFGHVPLAPGSPLPPYNGNHAWNAVKIDNGEWKLIDACWGAGHVQGAEMPYCRKFASERFTQSNEEFGLDHFPNNRDHFFLPGGRALSWEEYIQINPALWPYPFERPTFFDNAKNDYSIGKQTVMPPNRKISVHQPGTVRFSFGLFCPHWMLENHTRKGLPPVFILAAGGVDGRNKHYVPLEHMRGTTPGGGGDMWYVDVSARELGAPGDTLTLFAVTSFGNREDARGLTVREFKDGIGRTGMGFVGVAAWELV